MEIGEYDLPDQYIGNGPPSEWLMCKYRNYVLHQIINQVNTHKEYKNKKNIFVNTAWIIKGEENQRKAYFKIQTCDNVFLLSLEDPFHNFWYTQNLKKNVIHIGYPQSSKGIPLDFWCLMCYHFFKKYKESDLFLKKNIENTFLCYQFKPHIHRQIIADKILQSSFKNKGIVTLGFFDKAMHKLLPEYRYLLKLKNLYNSDVYSQFGNTNAGSDVIDIYTLGCLKIWNTSFLNIVSETLAPDAETIFISEKTFKPIIGLRPFLIYGTPNIYKWLKNAKFEIFEDLWCGHNLLERTTTEKYIEKILDILLHYNSLSSRDLYSLYKKLLPRLYYNRNRFFSYAQEQENLLHNFHTALSKITL